MKTHLLALPLLALLSCTGTPSQTAVSHFDWTEPADPQGENPEAWTGIETPVVSFGSTDLRYPRTTPYEDAVTNEATLTGWRGEKVSAQAVVSAPAAVDGLTCTASDFRAADGAKLAGITRVRFVKYVVSDRFLPDQACGARPANNPAHLEADLLDEAASFDMPARSTRPLWITVDIPRDAAPGHYTSQINVKGKGVDETLTLHLNVTERTLPAPSEWAYHLDLWQHPAAVARVEGVPVWSDEHFERMRPTMQQLADAGQKVITATLNKEPWNNQCYDAYADMIVWTRLADGTWEYDFTVFDRWVEFMLELGIGKYINCYSMLPWNNMLHYKDAVTGEFVDVKADPGTPAFREMWSPFLPAFADHLRRKGWLDITNIAMDERSPEVMAEATALLKEVAPELGIALADNHKIFKQYPYIKDMCASIFGPIEQADIAQRRSEGLTTTFYVCCSSGFPNTYTSSAPAEATYLSWYAAAEDYDGFLRWAYNSWVEDPIRDSRFRTWAAGDTYLVYPEGRSSIRFERLVEGIQDWEKIRLLKTEFSGDEAKLQTLHNLLEPFRSSVAFDGWEQTLRNARATLNTL
ncbi:DUF4091 domain-containing protein [Alistipes sp. kh20]|uniref:DUF4091 domain-containing protein n=1 Tax=Alistipes montrealensis TaxID=2834113 RepID=UPI001BCE50A4|nr:DUF4091 domain-containing protein [Alistipes montrealensis]MBS4765192.1 DUF4091 domain-containing protein [Alistipes montrealensis]